MDKVLYNKILIVSAVLIMGSLIVFASFYSGENGEEISNSAVPTPAYFPPEEREAREVRQVTFTAPDGYVLNGTFWPSRSPVEKSPVLILVHEFNSNRMDFSAVVPTFQSNGYNVLTYDIRGFGQSKGGPTKLSDLPKDIIGAIEFLKKQPIVDGEHIGVIGAVFGANVVWLALGTVSEIDAAVLLSPSEIDESNVFSGSGIKDFSAKNVLIISNDRDMTAVDFLFNRASEPKERKIYDGYGRGASLLRARDVMGETLSFFNYYLRQ